MITVLLASGVETFDLPDAVGSGRVDITCNVNGGGHRGVRLCVDVSLSSRTGDLAASDAVDMVAALAAALAEMPPEEVTAKLRRTCPVSPDPASKQELWKHIHQRAGSVW
jgi:hypothetical protein